MARNNKFSWNMFSSFTLQEKVWVLSNYPLTTDGIVTNLFLLIRFYIAYFSTSNLKGIFTSMEGKTNKSLFEYNFKKVISYCKMFNFYSMR